MRYIRKPLRETRTFSIIKEFCRHQGIVSYLLHVIAPQSWLLLLSLFLQHCHLLAKHSVLNSLINLNRFYSLSYMGFIFNTRTHMTKCSHWHVPLILALNNWSRTMYFSFVHGWGGQLTISSIFFFKSQTFILTMNFYTFVWHDVSPARLALTPHTKNKI